MVSDRVITAAHYVACHPGAGRDPMAFQSIRRIASGVPTASSMDPGLRRDDKRKAVRRQPSLQFIDRNITYQSFFSAKISFYITI
jgi:hypothetical protein